MEVHSSRKRPSLYTDLEKRVEDQSSHWYSHSSPVLEIHAGMASDGG